MTGLGIFLGVIALLHTSIPMMEVDIHWGWNAQIVMTWKDLIMNAMGGGLAAWGLRHG